MNAKLICQMNVWEGLSRRSGVGLASVLQFQKKEMFCDIACNPAFCEVFDNSTKLYKIWLVHMEFYVCDVDSAVGLSP